MLVPGYLLHTSGWLLRVSGSGLAKATLSSDESKARRVVLPVLSPHEPLASEI